MGFFYSGGGERTVLNQAKGLMKKGHQVKVYAPIIAKDCFPELAKDVELVKISNNIPESAPLKTALKMIVLLHTIFLIPLIVLYSLSYLSTIVILIGGAIITLFGVKPKKDFPISPTYYTPFVFAGVVYLSCMIYHICMLLGESIIGLLPFVDFFQ